MSKAQRDHSIEAVNIPRIQSGGLPGGSSLGGKPIWVLLGRQGMNREYLLGRGKMRLGQFALNQNSIKPLEHKRDNVSNTENLLPTAFTILFFPQ